jgi:hypothetical protein
MRKILTVVATVVLLLLMLPVASAGATRPSGVAIEVETSFIDQSSPFVASGPAVDDGVICDAGEVHDDSGRANGLSPNGFNFQGIKHFVCADGSGGFLINLQARIDFRKSVTFNWNVLNGTGAYADLHGAGSGVGLPVCSPECVLDVYDGGLHRD